jgi:hypothetical protein
MPSMIEDWRNKLELALVEMLPENTQPIDSHGAEFTVMTGTLEKPRSVDCLSVRTRKLLRADALFRIDRAKGFYPDIVSDSSEATDIAGIFYDAQAGRIAAALLHALGRPNASSVEMQALNQTFLCGRCCNSQRYYSWEEIVRMSLMLASDGSNAAYLD